MNSVPVVYEHGVFRPLVKVDLPELTPARVQLGTPPAISASEAQQLVTRYLIDYVSDHLCGEVPELVAATDGQGDTRWLWRVPVALYLTSPGFAGRVGMIDVDAETGNLQITASLMADIEHRAHDIATRSASATDTAS